MNKINELVENLVGKDVLLITHDNCMDGIGCALVMMHMHKHGLPNGFMKSLTVEFDQYNSDKEIDTSGKTVVIADFSYKRDKLLKINEEAESLIVIDHHETSEKDLAALDFCVFDSKRSGCSLLWDIMTINKHEEKPLIIKYIEDRDLWSWSLPNSREVSAYLSALPKQEILRYDGLKYFSSEDVIAHMVSTTAKLIEYQDNVINKKVNTPLNDFYNIGGYLVHCINNTILISEVGNVIVETKDTPFSAQYFITDKDIVFSLRSIDSKVDVEKIAKMYKGGGHRNAAGFSIPLTEFDFDRFFIHKSVGYKL